LLIWEGLSVREAVRQFVPQTVAVVAVAYVVMLPLWPWAMMNPITGPFEAMGYFSKFLEPHFSYFDGQYVLNHDVPWFYVSKWLLLTLPELVLVGLLCGIVRLGLWRQSFSGIQPLHIQRFVLFWSAAFPTVYAAVMNTPFYDGYRHMLFVVPPLVVCSALGLVVLWQSLKSIALHRTMLIGVTALVMWTGVYMVRIHPNQSVYFNHVIAGGIQKASVNFETDYWGNSFKQGLDWVSQRYPWDYSKRKLQVASRFGQLHNVMDTTRFERVDVYEEADLYLGTTRFDYHRIAAGEVVHTVDVDSVPILYVIRPDDAYQNDPLFAGSAFRRMALRLRFEGPLAEEGRAVFLEQVEDLGLHYFVAGTYNNMAKEQHEKGNYDGAVLLYQEALSFYPGHLMALYNYGLALYQSGSHHDVIQQYEIAFEHQAKRILDKETLANMDYTLGRCYLDLEDFESANQVFQSLVGRYPKNTTYRMHLAKAFIKRDSVEAALKQCQAVIKLSPDMIDAHVLTGQIYQAIGQAELARTSYDMAFKIDPNNEMLQELIQSIEK
ncbi:MAG: tetratricopeptide repeat protein, partial [Candidatus Latescibacteria bacterium]|nr:tetratricopeptide repeat protein [Candidatus Latescibacterota bacterium]